MAESVYLTHTTGVLLDNDTIQARPNVDKMGRDVGMAIFATSNPTDRDFYALRHAPKSDEHGNNVSYINAQIPYNHDGKSGHFFIFQQMREKAYEYEVSSQNFQQVLGNAGKETGEWINTTDPTIQGIHKEELTQADVLKRSTAHIYTIAPNKLADFKKLMQDSQFIEQVKNPDLAYQAVINLERQGLLVRQNHTLQDTLKLCAEPQKTKRNVQHRACAQTSGR